MSETRGLEEGKATTAVDAGVSRRQFIVGVGGVGAGFALGGVVVKAFVIPEEVHAIPASEGYLLVDTKKCGGCDTCMLACSTVHHGRANLSLSRMQVQTDPFAAFPAGIVQHQCRQCPAPSCVDACPTGANHVDVDHGNVRMVDEAKCIGCERCIAACPFSPTRILWNHEDVHAQKCDLCSDSPHWKEDGGPAGKKACIEYCPLKAITYTTAVPIQNGWEGYQVNLRKSSPVWAKLGFPTSDSGDFTAAEAGGSASH